MASAERRTWDALCDGLGVPELKDALHQAEQAQQTADLLAGVFRARPAADWIARLSGSGASVTLVNHARQLLDDPHIRARRSIVTCGETPVPASPVRVMEQAESCGTTVLAPPGGVGDDTEQVLASAGYSAGEIQALAASGLI